MKGPRPPIPQTDGEHARQAAQSSLDTKSLKRREHHLGIAVAPEPAPGCLQFRAQFNKVVDLTVVSHDQMAALTGHRLPALLRQIDNGEPAVAKCYSTILVAPDSFAIRTPMPQRLKHGRQRREAAWALIGRG